MKKVVVFFIISILIISGFFILYHNLGVRFDEQKSKNELTQDSPSQPLKYSNSQDSSTQNDKNCPVVLTEYLVDPRQVQKVGQVGVVHGSGKSIVERSYISIKPEFYEQKILLYAPTDMTLISGAHYNNPSAGQNTMPDYVLKFDAGCGVEILLGHMKGVIPEIAAKLTPLKQDSREDEIRPGIEFKAGDKIGYYFQENKEGAVAGFDFIVRDSSVTNQFINQERYSDDRARNLIHGVCPYDYYTPEKKQDYYNLFGGSGGKLFEVKDCGASSRDKKGTISGMWFLDKEIVGEIYDNYKDGEYGSPISLVGDEEAVTFGNIGQSPTLKVYANEPTYKLPIQITTEHCYNFGANSRGSGFAYFKIINDETMDVYYSSSGNCPSTIPQNPKRYYK